MRAAAGTWPCSTTTSSSPDWLELLVAELERDRVGFVTGKIMRHDDREVIEQAGHDFFTCGHFEPAGSTRGTLDTTTNAARRRS